MSEVIDSTRSSSPMGMRDDETYSRDTAATNKENVIQLMGVR